MATDIIRVSIAVRVDNENLDAKKVAQEFRDAHVAEKLQHYLANIAGPAAMEGLELEVLDDEHLTHQCDWYEQDECSVCRFGSSYALEYTQRRHF